MATETFPQSAVKAEILRRIRKATGITSDAAGVQAEWDALPRNYQRAATLAHESVLELLVERLIDYDADVVRTTVDRLPENIAERLQHQDVRRLVVPQGLPAEWLHAAVAAGFEFVVDNGLSATELDGFDGVITSATLAIAETGTVALQNVPGQGRRVATLVPDYHLCIVHERDIVQTVPQSMDRLAATSQIATTFVSGPSATADIEMTRIKGVHGPRVLDVILIR
jgi:L-lactate dehydrogenase complex protein LldG